MANYLRAAIGSRKETPQTQPIPGRTDQVVNSAGGYVFAVDDWKRLERFLILGSEGGTYYASEWKLTKKNADAVLRLLKEDGTRVVETVVQLSESGRAPKNDPALFVLALAASPDYANAETNAHALANLSRVARIGTHLFHFAAFVDEFRGWGRSLRTAIAHWYLDKPNDKLANQVVKYQSRDGWSHRDLLRLCHADATHDSVKNYILNYAARPTKRDAPVMFSGRPDVIRGFEAAKIAGVGDVARLIREYSLTREMVPTEALNSPEVWEALLEDMPMTAMIRNLGNMSKVGLLAPLSTHVHKVVNTLNSAEAIQNARVHPLSILVALKTYASGRSLKGHGAWTPVPQVVDALDNAFYLAFANVVPTGKRYYIGVDVSGSMSSPIAGTNVTAREAACALALMTAHTENNYYIAGFQSANDNRWSATALMIDLGISRHTRLRDMVNAVAELPFGCTDCALPMLDAKKKKLDVDCFIILTDNETYAGTPHPVQALKQYRDSSGIDSKLVVAGLTSSGFTIADPTDAGQLDVVGFDTAVPQIISDFVRE